ncbi:adhesion G protein-coupled receptor E3-like isoform X2 [Silurus meridionalis]|nr:adhesion G protein-coupled receptor E3-like isoform X2 [Silurus meridionalis]
MSNTRSDISLNEGWYRFTSVGGDKVITSCGSTINTTSHNLTVYNLFTCNSSISYTNYINCSQGFTVYYLRPTKQTYATRHSVCSNSSCGPNAQCGTVFGSCVCNPGLVPNLLMSNDSYGCSVLTVPSGCKTVELYLSTIMNVTTSIDAKNSTDNTVLIKYANNVLTVTEKLVSSLVAPTETENTTRIQLDQMEAEVFTVGKNTSLIKIPPLNASSSSLNIDLIEISKQNNGTVIILNLYYVTSDLIFVNFIPRAKDLLLQEFTALANRSCVYWNETEWIEKGCMATEINSTYTVCSCVHLSTFAMIMQTDPDNIKKSDDDALMNLINIVAVSVGLFFLFLTILTLTFCQRGTKVTNTALLNLSLSLFLAHITFLLTQQYLQDVQKNNLMCLVLAGITHFLFLSAFVWMLIEAILLYIFVKNLSKISSMQTETLNWKYMIIIGYVIPLAVVGVTSGLCPGSYSEEHCWLTTNFVWTFLGPVSCIIAINLLLSCVILINLRQSLANLNKTVTQLKQTRTLVLKTLLQFVILGCPWVLGFFANSSTMINIVFLFFNSQQGTFIFIVHCVFNQEVKTRLFKQEHGRVPPYL